MNAPLVGPNWIYHYADQNEPRIELTIQFCISLHLETGTEENEIWWNANLHIQKIKTLRYHENAK